MKHYSFASQCIKECYDKNSNWFELIFERIKKGANKEIRVRVPFITRILRHCDRRTTIEMVGQRGDEEYGPLSFSLHLGSSRHRCLATRTDSPRNDTARYRSPRREPETFHVPFALVLLSNDVYMSITFGQPLRRTQRLVNDLRIQAQVL